MHDTKNIYSAKCFPRGRKGVHNHPKEAFPSACLSQRAASSSLERCMQDFLFGPTTSSSSTSWDLVSFCLGRKRNVSKYKREKERERGRRRGKKRFHTCKQFKRRRTLPFPGVLPQQHSSLVPAPPPLVQCSVLSAPLVNNRHSMNINIIPSKWALASRFPWKVYCTKVYPG